LSTSPLKLQGKRNAFRREAVDRALRRAMFMLRGTAAIQRLLIMKVIGKSTSRFGPGQARQRTRVFNTSMSSGGTPVF
jgi:hypothetical protein